MSAPVSLCKHSFPVQPPRGSIFRPGDCTGCGTTWNEAQAELQRQEQALILGTSHDGTCPDCNRHRRLFRFQPPLQPWHEPDAELPVSFLCVDCFNAAADTAARTAAALFDRAMGGTR